MSERELINKYFEKESLTKMLTSYILYYQISLGSFAYETTQDPEETISKIHQLNLTLDPNTMILLLLEIIINNSSDKNLENNIEEYIKNKAILHALEDFVKHNNELLNKNIFLEYKKKEILEKDFFNSKMKMQYLSEYAQMMKFYGNIITEDYTNEIKKILNKNFMYNN